MKFQGTQKGRLATRWVWAMRLLVAVAPLISVGLAGCHTTEGFGRDMESAGSKLKEKAQEHEDD